MAIDPKTPPHEAFRQLQTRLDEIKGRIRELPTSEKLHLAAELIEGGQSLELAKNTAQLAADEISAGRLVKA